MSTRQAPSRARVLAIALIGLASLAQPASPQPTSAPLPDVFRPYTQALAESKRTGKPLLLFFTNPHCVPCYWLEAEIFNKTDSAAIVSRLYVPVRLVTKLGPGDKTPETPEARRVASRYGIVATPNLVAISASDKFLGSVAWLGRDAVLYRLETWAKASPR